MNYYQELGVSEHASDDQIHSAYKALARLLHPDSHTEPSLKILAERQMQRLNEILATLTDQERRRQYDAGLGLAHERADVPPPEPKIVGRPVWVRKPDPVAEKMRTWGEITLQHWFSVLIGAVIATSMVWYILAGRPSAEESGNILPPLSSPSPVPLERDVPKTGEPAKVDFRPETVIAPVTRPEAPPPRELSEHSRVAVAQPPLTPPASRSLSNTVGNAVPSAPASASVTPVPTTPAQVLASSAQPASPPPAVLTAPASVTQEPRKTQPEPMFAGNWFYVPTKNAKQDPALYVPEYIELLLTRKNGDLDGKYHARYHVSNATVSPEVTFEVSGAIPAGPQGTLAWTSGNGAKGGITLKMESPGVMDVTWWTTTFGSSNTLSSGNALLVRQSTR